MILITGGAGYIGSHINKQLNKQGYDTIVIDNLVYGHKEAVKWGAFIEGDLSNLELLNNVFSENKIDTVFHMAAFAYVGESVLHPAKYYRNNVVCSVNLLDTMLKHNVKKIVFSSTCATYGAPSKVPITEDMPQNPINPYGASKLMIERILKDYETAYGIRHAALRYFNAAGADPDCEIGESHTPETHLIPLILAAAAGDNPCIEVYGADYQTHDGSCIRDYIHVTDLADAHVRAMDYINANEISLQVNLGNAKGYSVIEVIDAAKSVTGHDFHVKFKPRREGDPPELVGSRDKAMGLLGWKPQYDKIHETIKHAWSWYKKPGRY